MSHLVASTRASSALGRWAGRLLASAAGRTREYKVTTGIVGVEVDPDAPETLRGLLRQILRVSQRKREEERGGGESFAWLPAAQPEARDLQRLVSRVVPDPEQVEVLRLRARLQPRAAFLALRRAPEQQLVVVEDVVGRHFGSL